MDEEEKLLYLTREDQNGTVQSEWVFHWEEEAEAWLLVRAQRSEYTATEYDEDSEDDPMPREDVLNLYHEINTAIDDSCVEDENREYDIDVFKYRLLRAYNKLVDDLYPE